MNKNFKKGFTLIELLIVIAILGTLAVVVLVALNPVQQLARTRDAGRLSSVAQMGHAMQALATVRNGVYPVHGGAQTCRLTQTAGANWVENCLVTGGEISAVPANPNYSAAAFGGCGAGHGNQGNWCLVSTATAATIYTRPEANSNLNICPTATHAAYFVYATNAGRGGVWCGAAAPSAGITGSDSGWIN